jgi:hypothetical protein
MSAETWAKIQPGESQAQFEAFVAYRDFGPGRSIKDLAAKLGCKPQTLYNLSHRMNWDARIRAFNQHMEEKRAEIIQERHNEAAGLEAEIEHMGLTIIQENFKRIVREQKKDENYIMPAGAATQIYDFFARNARAGRGKAGIITENRTDTNAELGKIVLDILENQKATQTYHRSH